MVTQGEAETTQAGFLASSCSSRYLVFLEASLIRGLAEMRIGCGLSQ